MILFKRILTWMIIGAVIGIAAARSLPNIEVPAMTMVVAIYAVCAGLLALLYSALKALIFRGSKPIEEAPTFDDEQPFVGQLTPEAMIRSAREIERDSREQSK